MLGTILGENTQKQHLEIAEAKVKPFCGGIAIPSGHISGPPASCKGRDKPKIQGKHVGVVCERMLLTGLVFPEIIPNWDYAGRVTSHFLSPFQFDASE